MPLSFRTFMPLHFDIPFISAFAHPQRESTTLQRQASTSSPDHGNLSRHQHLSVSTPSQSATRGDSSCPISSPNSPVSPSSTAVTYDDHDSAIVSIPATPTTVSDTGTPSPRFTFSSWRKPVRRFEVMEEHDIGAETVEDEQFEEINISPYDDPPPLLQRTGVEKYTKRWPVPQVPEDRLDTDELGEKTTRFPPAVVELKHLLNGLGRSRWTGYKWCLLASILTVFIYGMVLSTYALMTWFRTWKASDVFLVADADLVIVATLASCLLIFSSLVGLSGIILDSRPILAVYALLLWPCFITLLTVGYSSYKKSTFSLDHKLNLAWSRYFTETGRRMVQDNLNCCGYYNSFHQITATKKCFTRSPLPGCKGPLWQFERVHLNLTWMTVFSLVPLHVANIFASLLCANHVTPRFGTGVVPPLYRLTTMDVKWEAERLVDQDLALSSLDELYQGPESPLCDDDEGEKME